MNDGEHFLSISEPRHLEDTGEDLTAQYIEMRDKKEQEKAESCQTLWSSWLLNICESRYTARLQRRPNAEEKNRKRTKRCHPERSGLGFCSCSRWPFFMI